MAFAAGAAVFNSCNKAGAVDHFTRHLATNPGDWKALMWRGRAYSILGQNQNAVNDLDRAINVSQGVQRKLAMAEKKLITCTDVSERLGALKQITDEHPDCWEAYYQYGALQKQTGNTEGAIRSLRTAVDIAGAKRELKDPCVCWIYLELGRIWSDKGETDVAINYFKDAIQSSPTHTISYIYLCHMNLRQGKLVEAKQNFETANRLNPTLVKQIFEVDTFDAFMGNLKQQIVAASLQEQKSSSSTEYTRHQPASTVQVPTISERQPGGSSTSLEQQKVQSARFQTHQEASNAPSVLEGQVSNTSGYQALVSQEQQRPMSARTEKTPYSSNTSFVSQGQPRTRSFESELQKDFNNKMYVSSQADNGQAVRYQDFGYKYSAPLGQQRATSAGSDRQRGVYTTSTLLAANSANYEVEPVLGRKSKNMKPSRPVAGSTKEERSYSSGATGNGGGRGGDGSGSGSDDDEDNPFSGMDVSQIWKKLQKESPNIKMYGKHKYVQSKCGQYWYSKDTAGHGGAAFKRYDNSRSYISFRDSLDAKMRPMRAKHESRENTMIFKSDMVGVRGK